MSSIPPELQTAVSKSEQAQHDLVKSTPQLDNALSNSKSNGLPNIAIGPAQGSYLSILCQMTKAKSVLEIGTLGGYSTIWFATSVPGIKVTSIEYNEKHRDVAAENTKDLDNVEIILAAALDVLPQLAEKGEKFDFIFIDADWEEQEKYFDWAVKLSSKGSCIFVDNAVRQLTESNGDEGKALVDYVSKDERVQATLIPMLNTYKRTLSELADGFVMAIVK
ncbi:uncharacterized protein LTR77_005775 [Saxophila tyrrhenica]|uniref:O-methyltransferase n=1 Tax=Saxophila tyrrhenica TaxID=1690608 RepID=A0AAV9PA23_9PEZI|nr:hypothetical protein LTR77_005775 [Saxophila tyrrhenica]